MEFSPDRARHWRLEQVHREVEEWAWQRDIFLIFFFILLFF